MNDWNKMILEPEDIVLQDYLVPTVRGNLIKAQYFIEVSFTHAGLTLGSSIPKIVFPIYLFAPEIQMDLHHVSAPLDYHPVELNALELKDQF